MEKLHPFQEKDEFSVTIPNLFGTRNLFHGRQFFHRPGSAVGWFHHDSSTLHIIEHIIANLMLPLI